MGSYYYALASLPNLRFDSDLIPSRETFLEVARDWSSDSEYADIVRATLDPEETDVPSLVGKFLRWEMGLRNELARQRGQDLGRDALQFIHRDETGDDNAARSGLAETVRAAVQASNPLEADEVLDRLRWDYLGELEIGNYFNLDHMIVYYLRLQILLRRQGFTAEAGRKAFDAHYETVHMQMQETQNINGEQA